MQNLVELIKSSAIFRKLAAEAERTALEARQRDAERRRQLQDERRARNVTHATALEPLIEAETAARKKLEVASERRVACERQYRADVAALDRDLANLDARLRRSADPCIDAAIKAIADRWDQSRASARRSDERPIPGRLDAEFKPVVATWSNDAAIQRLTAAIRTARLELETLKLQPVDQAALNEAIAAIERSIPWDGLAELEPEPLPAA